MEAGTGAAKLPDTPSTRGDDMPVIEVGDLVKRTHNRRGPINKVYLVAEIEKCALRDIPSWCKLHNDEGRLTAVKALTVVLKALR